MVKQFLSPGFEREILQELAQDYECALCFEPITNPICHNCLGKEVLKWLSFYPDVKKKMAGKIKNYVADINNSAKGEVVCASCRKDTAALCPYCFSEEIFNMFKRNKVDRMVIMDFLSVFNFDLGHEKYYQEAIK